MCHLVAKFLAGYCFEGSCFVYFEADILLAGLCKSEGVASLPLTLLCLLKLSPCQWVESVDL